MSPILGIIASSQTASTLTAFESIATATGTGSSGTITFSSIPSTYQHLQIRGIGRSTTAATGWDDLLIRVNGDTATNYSWHYLEGTGAAAGAGGAANATYGIGISTLSRNNNTSGIVGATIIDLHDYASTTKNKTGRLINGGDLNGSGTIYLASFLWRSTSAITSISLIANGTNFGTTSTFALYGIKGA